MTKAKNMKRGDTFSMNAPMKVLSVEIAAPGLVKIKAETENAPSPEFLDGGCVLEFICKAYRPFAAHPWRGDDDGDGGGGGGGGGDDGPDIDPVSPADLVDA
jgi:hypothetical protein